MRKIIYIALLGLMGCPSPYTCPVIRDQFTGVIDLGGIVEFYNYTANGSVIVSTTGEPCQASFFTVQADLTNGALIFGDEFISIAKSQRGDTLSGNVYAISGVYRDMTGDVYLTYFIVPTKQDQPIEPISSNKTMIILSGQSNARANFSASNLVFDTLYKWNNEVDLLLNNNDPNIGQAGFYLGSEYKKLTGDSVLIVQTAVNSSAMTHTANPSNNWSATGNLRLAAANQINAAVAAFNPDKIYMVISQGEQDAVALANMTINRNDYYSAFENFAQWANQWTDSIFIVQTGTLANQQFYTGSYATIRDVQDSLVSTTQLMYGSTLAKYFVFESLMRADGLHYSDQGYSDIYREVANVIAGGNYLPDELQPTNAHVWLTHSGDQSGVNWTRKNGAADTIINGNTFINLIGNRCLQPTNLSVTADNYLILAAYQHVGGIHFWDSNTNRRLYFNHGYTPVMYFNNGDFSASNNATNQLAVTAWYLDDAATYNNTSRYLNFRNMNYIEQACCYTKVTLGNNTRIGHNWQEDPAGAGDILLGELIIMAIPSKRDFVRLNNYLYNKWINK